jgi:hypothetical protein
MVFDNTDKLRLATRAAQNGDTEIIKIGADGKATKFIAAAYSRRAIRSVFIRTISGVLSADQ